MSDCARAPRAEQRALSCEIGLGVPQRRLELLERRGRLVAKGREIAIVQLGQQLPLGDAVADLHVEALDHAGDARADFHLGADARLDHARRLHLRSDVASGDANDVRRARARIGAARRARAGHRQPGDRDPSDNRADPDGPLHARLGSVTRER